MIVNTDIIFRQSNPNGTLAGYSEDNNNNFGFFDSQGILAGKDNLVSGNFSLILGGKNNSVLASNSTILAGSNTTINSAHSGAVVIADSINSQHVSYGPNTLTLDFISGVCIKLNTTISSPNSPGTSGQISFDNNYFYRHNGTNWTRTAMSIW